MFFSNKNELRTILDSEITSSRIVEIIKDRFSVKLPNKGHLCGQSVSSAIFELLLMDIEPVYNDIDIFYIVSSQTFQNSISFSKIRENEEKMESNQSVFYDLKNMVDHYDQKNFVFNEYSYKVESSIKQGPLNKTYISYLSNSIFTGRYIKYLTNRIIENFDINATQVGISLETMKIAYTEEFLEFLLTKQLRIVRFNTPNHSLIRLAKKSEELKGTYVDFEEAKMLTMVYTHSFKNILEAQQVFKLMGPIVDKDISNKILSSPLNNEQLGNVPLLFGEKHLNDFLKYFMDDSLKLIKPSEIHKSNVNYKYYSGDIIVGKNMNIYNQSQCCVDKDRHIFTNKKSYDLRIVLSKQPEIYFSKILKFFENNEIKSANFKKIQNSMENLFFNIGRESSIKSMESIKSIDKLNESISFSNNAYVDLLSAVTSIPKIYMSLKKTNKKTKKIFVNLNNSNAFTQQCTKTSELMLFTDINEVKENNIQYIKKNTLSLFKKHAYGKYGDILSLSEVVTFTKNIQAAEKEFGLFIHGVLETNTLDKYIILNRDLFFEFLKKEQVRFREPLKENKISLSIENISIEELITAESLFLEGEQMRHCVGGYSDFVSNEKSYIFKVFSKEKGLRCTIEIKRDSEDKFSLFQVRGKFNKTVDFKLVKPVLDILNKKFEYILPMNSFVKSNFLNIEECDLKYFKKNNSDPKNTNIPIIDIDNGDIPF